MHVRTEQHRSAHALMLGLGALRRRGATPRNLLFLALDHAGGIHLAYPDDIDAVGDLRVGDKLTLEWPFSAESYYFDSIHRLPGDLILLNGDRRLAHPGNASEIAETVATFLKAYAARNVFFGCTPHQPGTWLLRDGRPTALHDYGYVEAVSSAHGLLARRIVDAGLYFIPYARLDDLGAWTRVYTSPLGNVVMLERRIVGSRLALSCERGLIEIDVEALPAVRETVRAPLAGGFAVVGRVDGGAFAVTTGKPQPWGLDGIVPARLIGAKGSTLIDLAQSIAAAWASG